MAAQCVADLEAAVEKVKAEYGDDPKWKAVIDAADNAVSEAHKAESPVPDSPGKKAADQVHAEENAVKVESADDEKNESPQQENSESSSVEQSEHPKDLKGAAHMAILMLRNRKK